MEGFVRELGFDPEQDRRRSEWENRSEAMMYPEGVQSKK